VIIDDISRLARGIDAHWKLRDEILVKRAVFLKSPSVKFGDDSDSHFYRECPCHFFFVSSTAIAGKRTVKQQSRAMKQRLRNGLLRSGLGLLRVQYLKGLSASAPMRSDLNLG